MDVDVKISGVQKVKSREDWVDPVAGVRWMPQIADKWHLMLKGDIGGFGIASDFTWNLQGGFAWDATDYLSLVFQYRALSVDYSSGTVGTPGCDCTGMDGGFQHCPRGRKRLRQVRKIDVLIA